MQRDGHVRLLPIHVANKIAAGEVVERPASVLKELLENSLDAGSTRVEVNVVAGGRNLVSVRDDGCGMTREDTLLSLERQATSKIRDVDDIERIDTLGFRGEAIPSIASVSRFTLTTRRHCDEAGTRVVVNAGTLAEAKDCGAPPGTCVEVRDLFCNVPARRKFLRAYATEEAHIRAAFTVHALAHPDVGFSLVLDGRETYRFAPGATLEERICDLFGASFVENLVPVGDAAPSDPSAVNVHGYIERPSASASIRRDQFIFVNGRPATASAINYAVREAYPRGKDDERPVLVLFIDLPPSQVDVNVHPAKREVRFRRPADVREAVISAISAALTASSPQQPAFAAQNNHPAPTPPSSPDAPFSVPFTSAPIQTSLSLPHQQHIAHQQPVISNPSQAAEASALLSAPTDEEPAATPCTQPTVDASSPCTNLWRWFKFLAQTSTGYLILETDSGLVLVDPRAARARIAYETLVERRENVSQPLLIPETVQLPPGDSARIRSFLSELSAVGFQIEEFGRDLWKVDAVPDILAGSSTAATLASIAADIAEGGARRGAARWRDELVARAVSRTYASASTQLTPEAATKLVEELAGAKMPYVCPRGKPVMIYRSNREVARSFGRQQT
jgi:DNA mismatch repair protein MutL